MTPLVFTLSQLLWSILIALLLGAFFGRRIAKEARELLRPGLGELMMREAKDRGAQVLRLAGLSNARLIGNELEGTWRKADIVEDESEPRTITTPEYRTPPKLTTPLDETPTGETSDL